MEYLYYGDIYSDPCDWGDYIDDFAIGNLNHTGSGCDGGFNVADFTYMSVDLEQGVDYEWVAGIGNPNYLAIWFDINNDGTFDETECLFTSPQHVPSNASGIITIPAEAELGEHRLRIRTSWQDPPIGPEQACFQFAYGEAHDYSVNVVEFTNIEEISRNIYIYPNPSSDGLFTLEFKNVVMGGAELQIFNTIGENVFNRQFNLSDKHKEQIQLSEIMSGIYILKLQTERGIFTERLIIK